MARARSLSMVEFAETSARLARPFAERSEILAESGLDEGSWESTKHAMSLFMTTRLGAGDRGGIDAYRAAFEGIPLPRAEASEMIVPLADAAPPPRLSLPETVPAQIPSYLRHPLPSESKASPLGRPAVSPPTDPRSLAGQVETDEMDMSAFRGPASTPFATPHASQISDPARRAEQQRADEKLQNQDREVVIRMQQAYSGVALGETRPAEAADFKKPLPFGAEEKPKHAIHPAVNRAPQALVATAHLPEGSAAPEAKPFEGIRRHPPTVHLQAGLPEQSGFTRAGSSGGRPSIPFQRGPAPSEDALPRGWDLARYAALCIDLHATGLPEPEVLKVAGITNEERRALDAYWEHRMVREPALRVEWKSHADRRGTELAAGPPKAGR